MGTNSSKFDMKEHYSKMSSKELQSNLKSLQEFVEKHRAVAHHKFYDAIAIMQLEIAERIGKGKRSL
jgi:hypothetical protein